MTSLYEVLKAQKMGAAIAPDYFTALWAGATGGGEQWEVIEYTGAVPVTITAAGEPLIDLIISGNMNQASGVSPTTPIQPQECGERTGNLWDEDYTGISSSIKYVQMHVGEGLFTLSTTAPMQGETSAALFLLAGNVSSGASGSAKVYLGNPLTVTAIDGYVTVAFRGLTTVNPADYDTMLNSGSTALPYSPYGYKLEISSGNTTTPE